jgi:purine-binding chemotaxis protein CheW
MNNLLVQHSTASDNVLMVQKLQGQYLTFQVANEGLGINIHEVKEVIEISNITRVPMTPDYIKGVINLRGNVVPVIDLSSRLGYEKSSVTKRSCIILIEIITDGELQSIGMLVDQVKEILEISNDNIQPAPEFGADIRVDFIQAMGRVGDEFIILLEISSVLSVSELSQLRKTMKKEALPLPELESE